MGSGSVLGLQGVIHCPWELGRPARDRSFAAGTVPRRHVTTPEKHTSTSVETGGSV